MTQTNFPLGRQAPSDVGSAVLLVTFALTGLNACADDSIGQRGGALSLATPRTTEDAGPGPDGAHTLLRTTSNTFADPNAPAGHYCVDPEEPAQPPATITARLATRPAPASGALSVDFQQASAHSITIWSAIVADETDDDGRDTGTRLVLLDRSSTDDSSYVLHRGKYDFALRTPSSSRITSRAGSETRTLVAPSDDLSRYEIATTYTVNARGGLTVDDVALVHADTHVAVSHAGGAGHLVDVPSGCEEAALVRFGPIPQGMPSFKWPENKGCDSARCVDVRLGYIHAVHDTWRMTQIMDVVASRPSGARAWAWGRPGIDQFGQSAGAETIPARLFGPYTTDRFETIRELYRDHLTVLREAHMDGIDLRLKCPEVDEQSGNACFSVEGLLGQHWVKGWVNICPRTWGFLDGRFDDDASEWRRWFDHVVGHELYHHHYAHIDGLGWRMVKDQHYHRHGNNCTTGTTKAMYADYGGANYDHRLTHLASYVNDLGDACNHRRVLLRNVDTYNTMALNIGRRVRSRDLWHWPMPAPPTAQPPTCVGGVGCLCEHINTGPLGTPPDGDSSHQHYCSDDDGQVECMGTKFGVATVGVCTRCADVRGPGCACRGEAEACDSGFCFGEDTGQGGSYGTCYRDPPPLFACLANCEDLLGSGAFCMNDHPVRARCVPYGTTTPEAYNCWESGGHMDPNQLACTGQPECGAGAPSWNGHPSPTCQDLGYSAYFVCDASQRCVVDI